MTLAAAFPRAAPGALLRSGQCGRAALSMSVGRWNPHHRRAPRPSRPPQGPQEIQAAAPTDTCLAISEGSRCPSRQRSIGVVSLEHHGHRLRADVVDESSSARTLGASRTLEPPKRQSGSFGPAAGDDPKRPPQRALASGVTAAPSAFRSRDCIHVLADAERAVELTDYSSDANALADGAL